MIQVQKNNFQSEVIQFKGVIVADFYASWCGPCKTLSPLMDEMSKENKDEKVKFVKINVDEEQDLAGQYGVMSIPTVIFFKDGKRVTQQVGVGTKADYETLIKKAASFDPTKKEQRNVTVFSTPTCPYCHMVKAYLKQKNIAFEDIDVSKNREKALSMVQRSGQMGVPQLWIGDEVIVGFDQQRINQILDI